jgi:rRNA biogenesis protein RRP5
LNVADVRVGELMSGTVKKLTDTGLFVSIQGNVDGVIWPNHFADIPLKQPSRRFKVGGNVKCRVIQPYFLPVATLTGFVGFSS